MESFTQIENRIFGSDLPLQARFLWIVVRSFENGQEGCFAGIEKIAVRAGFSTRHTQRLWNLLIGKRYGRQTIRPGRSTVRFVDLPTTPDMGVTPDIPVGHDTQTTLSNVTPDTGVTPQPPTCTSPAPDMGVTHKSTTKNNTEKNNIPREGSEGQAISPVRTPKKRHPEFQPTSDHIWKTYHARYGFKPKVRNKAFFDTLNGYVVEEGATDVKRAWDDWLSDTGAFAVDAAHNPQTFVSGGVFTKHLARVKQARAPTQTSQRSPFDPHPWELDP